MTHAGHVTQGGKIFRAARFARRKVTLHKHQQLTKQSKLSLEVSDGIGLKVLELGI